MENPWRMELWESTSPSFETASTEVDPCRKLSGPLETHAKTFSGP